MIALVDYGAGNLASVRKGLVAAGAEVMVPAAPDDLAHVTGMVIPGVGHFARTAAIDAAWRDAIRGRLSAGVPLLGICLGLQWLYDGSEEAPGLPGLGVFSGVCTRLEAPDLKVPHVGWNSLSFARSSALMAGVPDAAQVYFTHTYAAPLTEEAVAVTVHGRPFAAAVARDAIVAVQFHPEKSGAIGMRILRNWVSMTGAARALTSFAIGGTDDPPSG